MCRRGAGPQEAQVRGVFRVTQVNQGSRDLFVGVKREMFNLDAITSSVSLLSALLPGITEKDPRNKEWTCFGLLQPGSRERDGMRQGETE